jgi:transposase
MRVERSAGSQAQASGKGSRRRHSMQHKLRVVRESLEPGVSTREVARRHGLHESLVGVWRRRYGQEGLQQAAGGAAAVKLLPVHLPVQAPDQATQAHTSVIARSAGAGAIHIEFSQGHRLSVRGEVCASTLSALIRELSGS